jgi:transglutaminase-like putative cysteine protease
VVEPFQPEPGTGSAGCLLTMEVTSPAGVVLQLAAARRRGLWQNDRLEVVTNGVAVPTREIVAADGTRQHLVAAQPGSLTVSYQATLKRTAAVGPDRPTEEERIVALRPSRYCPGDRMAGFAQSHFGELPDALGQVRAICSYVFERIRYDAFATGATTDAVDTLLTGTGVCRDFAHLVASLCRAVDIPARIAAVYAPGLSPMDFHAVVETAIDGGWWVWDATRLAPRQTLIRICTGRDAADVAFATLTSGRVEFGPVEIQAVASADLPLDDHEQLIALG